MLEEREVQTDILIVPFLPTEFRIDILTRSPYMEVVAAILIPAIGSIGCQRLVITYFLITCHPIVITHFQVVNP